MPAACLAPSAAVEKGCYRCPSYCGWRDPPIRDEEALYDIIDVIVDIADARNGRCHEN